MLKRRTILSIYYSPLCPTQKNERYATRGANICTSIVKIVICFSWSIYWQNVVVLIGFPSVLNRSFARLSKRTPILTNTKILIIFVMLNGYDSFYMNNFFFLLHKINTQYHFLVIFWPEAMTS